MSDTWYRGDLSDWKPSFTCPECDAQHVELEGVVDSGVYIECQECGCIDNMGQGDHLLIRDGEITHLENHYTGA